MINDKLLKSAAGAGGITPSDNFAVSIWSGDGGTNRNIPTGFDLSSNGGLVWIKKRTGSGGSDHILMDSVRGVSNFIYANDPAVEVANGGSTHNQLKTFDSDGFSVAQSAYTNASGSTYVAWSFLGGGSAVSNGDGSIASSVSANVAAGFSIVTYSGASTTSTVGHSLSSAPELIIVKGRNVVAGWPTLYNDGSNSYAMRLNSNAANDNGNKNAFFGNGSSHIAPTDSVFTVGNVDEVNQGYNYVAYCFHSVAGYSKIGEYDGTGTTSGNFVETGFEPAWLMIKCHTNSGTSWIIVDNKRNPSNPRRNRLVPNSNALEDGDYDQFEFFTTGFRANGTDTSLNGSGRKMIYMAFAADPDTTTPTLASSFSIHNYTGTGASRNILTSSLKTSGEIALYDFNTTTLTDDKTGNYSGGTNNNVTRNTSIKKFGDSSAEFNGSTSDIDLESGMQSSNMSVSLWVYLDATEIGSILYEFSNGYGMNFLSTTSGKVAAQYTNSINQNVLSNAIIPSSQWVHLVGVHTSSSVQLYVNNVLQSGGAVGDYYTSDQNTIGSRRAGEFYDGLIDQFRVFNYTLNATQVGYLYAETGNEVYRKPDFVWIKDRLANGEWNALTDSVRGKNSQLFSNEANAQDTKSTVVSDFIENGFTVVSDNLVNRAFTGSVGSYVAWCWKMLDNNNDNPELNEVGTIDSLVSVNALAGQSIVTYTGSGSAGATVGHSLGIVPNLVITKGLTSEVGNTNWNVYSSVTGATKKLALNSSSAASTGTTFWNDTAPTATVFSLGTTGDSNNNGTKYVAYCFANITGFSHIGTYDGTDNATTAITGVGFKPDLVVIKCHNNSGQWNVLDSVRGVTHPLEWNQATAEQTRSDFLVSFDTDGFTVAGDDAVSDNGRSFLYIAFKIN